MDDDLFSNRAIRPFLKETKYMEATKTKAGTESQHKADRPFIRKMSCCARCREIFYQYESHKTLCKPCYVHTLSEVVTK